MALSEFTMHTSWEPSAKETSSHVCTALELFPVKAHGVLGGEENQITYLPLASYIQGPQKFRPTALKPF